MPAYGYPDEMYFGAYIAGNGRKTVGVGPPTIFWALVAAVR